MPLFYLAGDQTLPLNGHENGIQVPYTARGNPNLVLICRRPCDLAYLLLVTRLSILIVELFLY